MKRNRVDVCCLLETNLSFSKVGLMHNFWLKSWKYLSNSVAASYARIVISWNPSIVNIDLFDFSAQAIHVLISSLETYSMFFATFVYGFNTILARRSLWEDLRRWCPSSHWIVLGDFNSILSQEDKHNGAYVTSYEVSNFRECCINLGIADLNSIGCFFTWSNGHV
jgi:hypothetical protein